LEKGEVFDSNQLKETVNSLIAAGKRNFAIDLSPLDYIYSDAINIILAMNRRILDVSGRLSLMSPSPEVKSILERAGLHNILKIYETETDLLKSSEDIILQTTRFNLSDLKSYQEPKPKSEYEDFRSEISTAMKPDVPGDAQQRKDKFNSFDTEIQDDSAQDQQPYIKKNPKVEEHFVPPVPPQPRPQAHPFEASQPAQRKNEQSIQNQHKQTAFEGDEIDTFETSRPAMQQPPKPRQHTQTGPAAHDRDFDRMGVEEEDYEEEKPKNTLVPIIIGIIVLCVLGIGGFIGFSLINKKSPEQVTKTVAPQQETPKAMPEIAQTPASAVSPEQPQVSAAANQPTEQPSEQTRTHSENENTPSAQPSSQEQEKKVSSRQSVSQNKQSESSRKNASRIYFTSKPSGATVTVDGKLIGTTPCRYTDPPEGQMTVVVSKQGYVDVTKTIDYSGGNKSESISLARMQKEAASGVPEASAIPTQSRQPESPRPSPRQAETVSKTAPVQASSASAQSTSSDDGETGTIFISSIPPVADVYMDGKLIGKTNISKLTVTAGTHTMKYVKGSAEITEELTFKSGENPSHLIMLKK
jgi:anti-anti-sigma factor